MAGTSSYPPQIAMPPAGTQVAIISPQFCAPYPVDLNIVRKLMTLSEGSFGVTDVNGNIIFKVKGKLFSLRDRRVLLDAAGNPLVTFQQKVGFYAYSPSFISLRVRQMLTAHRRWQVYRGESTDTTNFLFSVKKSSLLQFKTKLDVFLAHNTKEDVCDFRIEGSWFERSCAIYAGNTNTIIAQMHRKHTAQSILLGKDNFGVTVYPNVDYAFVVALVVILEEINEDRSGED
ncbi:protein LURP-one-related 10-like isoform X1 [Nicotiana tomentosiformis]|uniref:protein LURP-one-related 10-like isoform X1 n=1 Tax=Nicotiana tomentosiformis TaxID=4098 RepID=UPI00051AD71B|nr:protein LURP-one-related 10-like isoform X1 [Nicotiana tomentosiformis]